MWKAMLWGFECVLCSRMVGRFGMGIFVLRKGHQASSKPLSPIGIWTCRRKRDGGKLQLKEQHWQEASCSQVGQYLSSLHGFFHQQNDALLVIISCNLIKLSYNTFFWVYLNFNNSFFFFSSSIGYNLCFGLVSCWSFPAYYGYSAFLICFCAVCLLRFMGWSIRCGAGKGEMELKALKSWNSGIEGIKSLKEIRGKPELRPVCEILVLGPWKRTVWDCSPGPAF